MVFILLILISRGFGLFRIEEILVECILFICWIIDIVFLKNYIYKLLINWYFVILISFVILVGLVFKDNVCVYFLIL